MILLTLESINSVKNVINEVINAEYIDLKYNGMNVIEFINIINELNEGKKHVDVRNPAIFNVFFELFPDSTDIPKCLEPLRHTNRNIIFNYIYSKKGSQVYQKVLEGLIRLGVSIRPVIYITKSMDHCKFGDIIKNTSDKIFESNIKHVSIGFENNEMDLDSLKHFLQMCVHHGIKCSLLSQPMDLSPLKESKDYKFYKRFLNI